MEKDFLEKMMDILDCEKEINMESELNDIEEWDSLSFVSFLAMATSAYGGEVVAADVKSANTIGDLFELVK